MENLRLIQTEEEIEDEDVDVEEEEDDDDDYSDGDYEQELIPEDVVPTNFILHAEEEDEEDEDEDDDYDEDEDEDDDYDEEDDEELIPLPDGSIEDEDYEDEDEDYEDEDEDYEDEEEEEIMPPRVSSSFSDGRALVEDDSKSCEGKAELNRGEIDGLFCPICFEAWTSGGDHQICCLPCGHIYGSSCIKKWLRPRRRSGKCPQCNSSCTLKDVRVLYAGRLCVADEELHKRVGSLEAKCCYLEEKLKYILEEPEAGPMGRGSELPVWWHEVPPWGVAMLSSQRNRMHVMESRIRVIETLQTEILGNQRRIMEALNIDGNESEGLGSR